MMKNNMKKNIQLWIRGNSKGELNMFEIKHFTLTCIEAFDKMDPTRDLKTKIEFTAKDVVSYKKYNDEFEIWFEVEDALDVWRYPEKFEIDENFKLNFEDSNGYTVPFELTTIKIRYDGSETFDITK